MSTLLSEYFGQQYILLETTNGDLVSLDIRNEPACNYAFSSISKCDDTTLRDMQNSGYAYVAAEIIRNGADGANDEPIEVFDCVDDLNNKSYTVYVPSFWQ